MVCRGPAIDAAYADGETSTITLETGTYTLTDFDNDVDGQMAEGTLVAIQS